MDTNISKQTKKLSDEPILKLSVKMSMPVVMALIISSLYNIVDTIFISHYSNDALIAVTIAFPVQTFMFAIGVGTGIGANSYISRKMGEKNTVEAQSAAKHMVLIALLISLVFIMFSLFLVDVFLSFYDIPQTIKDMARTYIFIVSFFSIGYLFELIFVKIIQALGNTILPMWGTFAGAIINIFFDYVLIFGKLGFPSLGLKGAAIATIMGQFVSAAICIYYLVVKTKFVSLDYKNFLFNLETVKKIYAVGFPAIIMQSMFALLQVLLNRILNTYNADAVAVLGIYFRVYYFISIPVLGIAQGVMPVMGFNYGARNKKRLMDCIKISCIFSFVITLIFSIGFYIFPDKILNLFNPSEDILSIGISAFKIISFGLVLASIAIILSIFFQAIGKGKYSLLASFLRQLVTILPISYVLSRYMGVRGVWISFPISEVIAFITTVLVFIYIYNKEIKYF